MSLSKYFPLSCLTHGSILMSPTRTEHLGRFAESSGLASLPLTDIGNISQAVIYHNTMTAVNKKPVIGIQIPLCIEDSTNKSTTNLICGSILLYCKNYDGWKELLSLVYYMNHPDRLQVSPKICAAELSQFNCENWVCVAVDAGISARKRLRSLFKNYYDGVNPFSGTQRDSLENIVPVTFNAILNKERKNELFAILKKENSKAEMPQNQELFLENEIRGFGFSDAEIERTMQIYDLIDSFDISQPQVLPKSRENISLRELCNKGLHEFGLDNKEYRLRLCNELDVIEKANMEGYFLIMSDIMKYLRNNNRLVGTGRGCLSGNERVLTTNGFIELKDVQVGDFVYCQSGNANRVNNKFVYNNINETLLNIKTQYGDSRGITLTKDHKVLIARHKIHPNFYKYGVKSKKYQDFDGVLEWVAAESIQKGDMIFTPKLHREYCIEENLIEDLSRFCDGYRLTHDDNTVTHTHRNGKPSRIHSIKTHSRYINLDEDFYKFLGLFMGDGWFRSNMDYVIGLGFHAENKVDSLNFCINYCNKYNIDYTLIKHAKKQLVQLNIKSPFIYRLIKEHFNDYQLTSHTKHVPKQVFALSESKIKAFILGYRLSDGHEKFGVHFSTRSKRIMLELKQLFNIVGTPMSISESLRLDKRTNKKSIEYTMRCPKVDFLCNGINSTLSNFTIIDNGYLSRVTDIQEMSGINTVYDLEIENEHNYLTASGIVHNSAGGCLVSYLTKITSVDPVKYGLYFERFYNAERGGLPDIDVDIPPDSRDSIIEYIYEGYGKENFAQLSTFGTLKGAAALKLCLNINSVPFSEQNEITSFLPEEAKIDPMLEQQEREVGTRSLIYWALVNTPKELERWCILNNGVFDGKYAKEFDLAIKLDKVIVDRGRHASAFAISNMPLHTKSPMVYDSVSQRYIVGVEMNSAEKLGLIKLDLLGLDLLSKAEYMQKVLKDGSICQSRCW